jgi:hypothetical protein
VIYCFLPGDSSTWFSSFFSSVFTTLSISPSLLSAPSTVAVLAVAATVSPVASIYFLIAAKPYKKNNGVNLKHKSQLQSDYLVRRLDKRITIYFVFKRNSNSTFKSKPFFEIKSQ